MVKLVVDEQNEKPTGIHQDAEKNRNLVLKWIQDKYALRGQETGLELDSIRFREYMMVKVFDNVVIFSLQYPSSWGIETSAFSLSFNMPYDEDTGYHFRRFFTHIFKDYTARLNNMWDKCSNLEV